VCRTRAAGARIDAAKVRLEAANRHFLVILKPAKRGEGSPVATAETLRFAQGDGGV
jgi:hypothetical protein